MLYSFNSRFHYGQEIFVIVTYYKDEHPTYPAPWKYIVKPAKIVTIEFIKDSRETVFYVAEVENRPDMFSVECLMFETEEQAIAKCEELESLRIARGFGGGNWECPTVV